MPLELAVLGSLPLITAETKPMAHSPPSTRPIFFQGQPFFVVDCASRDGNELFLLGGGGGVRFMDRKRAKVIPSMYSQSLKHDESESLI
jgi:hypothetical protein